MSYDLNGNLKSHSGWSYGFNAHNRLVSASKSGTALSIGYDATGRLESSTLNGSKTTFLYDGDELVAEYSSSGSLLRRYVHGLGNDDPLVWYEGSGTGNSRYLLADEKGSIITETSSSGSVLAQHSYGPYGEPQNSSSSRFRYTGQILLPGTELYYYKARVYNPKLGRFMQTDPIGYEDGMNWYAYVGNDPVNWVDQTGESRTRPDKSSKSGAAIGYWAASAAEAYFEPGTPAHEKAKELKIIFEDLLKDGGRKGKYRKRNSQQQKKFREKTIENNRQQNDGDTKCENCGTPVRTDVGKVGKGEKIPDDRADAHHKDGNRNNNNADTNGELLCQPCHKKAHGAGCC